MGYSRLGAQSFPYECKKNNVFGRGLGILFHLCTSCGLPQKMRLNW